MKIFKSRLFLILILLAAVLCVRHFIARSRAFYVPSYEFEKVTEDMSTDRMFELTGLSPQAVQELKEQGNFERIETLNELYFKKPDFKRNYIAYPVTAEEKNTNQRTPLAPLKDGDILVTFNTHSCDWRHGHIAIVTDAATGTILEHLAIGQLSSYGYAPYWGEYPAFAVLRYPDEAKAKEAAEYAEEHLLDVPYSIFAGIIKKDKSGEDVIDSSHCSHIVWQAYKAVGADLDKNDGPVVTPRDVAMSPELEVVQIFGMNPKDYKDRLAEQK